MLTQVLLLLVAAVFMADAAAISSANALHNHNSPSTCACTTTVTHFIHQDLLPRQDCPPPVTITHIYQVAPPLATIVSGDPSSIASSFSYASMIDSMVHMHSSQDRPISEPPETTEITYVHTALGPAAVGSDNPYDSSVLYNIIATTSAPIATTTVTFPAEVTPSPAPMHQFNRTGEIALATVTTTVGLTTSTVTPAAFAPHDLEKRQVCSMIFALINGKWASWCNEWHGHTIVKQPTYTSTTLITHPAGGDPIPKSVYQSVSAATSSDIVTIQTSPPDNPSAAPIDAPTNSSSISALLKTESSDTADPVSTSTPDRAQPATFSFAFTSTLTVTLTVSTVYATPSPSSTTSEAPAPSSTCGQVGQFTISFDDLPEFSTSNPNNETTSPPIFDPYSHFYWSNGYGYGPPPNMSYPPHDGDRLAEYNPASESTSATRSIQGRDLPGSFGAGPRSFNNIFWFDAKSVFVGCNDTTSEDPCYIFATGYRWVASNALNSTKWEGHETVAFSQQYSVPGPCVARSCPLTQIFFDAAKFSGLSTLNLAAKLGNKETGFYIDTFKGAWTNSTCIAGLERSTSRK